MLFADSDAMVAGDAPTTTNLNLILNAIYTYQLSVPEPSAWLLMLIGLSGVGLATYRNRRKRATPAVG